jgi:branched-chain amino acid transport system ATP-binding protein
MFMRFPGGRQLPDRPAAAPARLAAPSAGEPILAAENLRLRYANGALGILDISFQVAAGQIVGLFGPNGAGKTSTVRAVAGFLRTEGARVTRGRVILAGEEVTNREPHRQARLGVSLVPERNKIFPSLSVADNLAALGRPPRGARRAALNDFVFSLFPVLVERRRELAGRLSGGQRQMLALGRAILSDPKVLLVDEMTLGLHHSIQPPLFDAIGQVAAAGTAVVIVDESAGLALGIADYCYILSAGKMHEHGPAQNFRGRELATAGYVDAD